MINTTRWSPDTCGCILEYTWDTEAPDGQRSHTFKTAVRVCQTHAALGHVAGLTHYSAVLDENQRKNLVLGIAQSLLASIAPEDYVWAFGPTRALSVRIARLSNPQKTQLQRDCDAQFGANVVQVQ